MGPPLGFAGDTALEEMQLLTELVCVDCHRGSSSEYASAAERLDFRAALAEPGEHLELLTTAFAQVRQGFMPPSSAPGGGFDEEDRDDWTAGVRALARTIDRGPGRATLRRMTRRQIRRTLKQLLGLDVPVDRFLERDASGYGFDTTGDTLFVTPLGYENWYECVEFIVQELRSRADYPARAELNEATVSAVLRSAFSREAAADEVAARLELGLSEEGDGWLDVVRATLLSQEFLYRIEGGDSGTPGPNGYSSGWVEGHTLASRLSFFLHGARPDTALLDRFEDQREGDEEGLRAIVMEMLDDSRSRSLAEDFAVQWMGTSELGDVTPDVRRYSAFNEGLRTAMALEVIEFFDDLVRQDRSALECLDSEFVFVNRRLAKHYGMEEVEHRGVRRIPRQSAARGGILGMAGVLTITSNPLRTSPVKRGQWVLERIFHAPAPPPPPNAGVLPEDDQQDDGISLAARLAAHRASPKCSACHDQMDPWGLALERFDGIGRWRETKEGVEADPPAVLPDGRAIEGPADLKALLASEPRRFLESFASALFTYAVGRPPTLIDLVEIDEAVDACIEDGCRVRRLVVGVALSTAMTHRPTPDGR